MPDDRTNAEPSLEEQLVAYLDGELDAEVSHQIEELLLTEPEVRQTLQRLDRTWDLLDELDRPQLDDRFTRSTLEMVTVAATKDVKEAWADAPRRRRRRWALTGLGLLVAGLAGFAAVAWWASDRNRQLVHDLPILLDLDSYRQIEDIEFLRMLRDEGLFAETDPLGPGDTDAFVGLDTVGLAQDPTTARQTIELMSPNEQEQLGRRHERFESLPSDEQQKIREFYDRLEQASDGDQLRGVMRRYHQWLTTLPPYEKVELAELDAEDRMQPIEELLAVEQQRQVRTQDIEGVVSWLTDYASRNEARLLETLPEMFRLRLKEFPEPFRHRLLGLSILQPRQDAPGENGDPLTEDDLKDLCSHLSEQTRSELEGLSASDRWKWIRGTVALAFQQRRFNTNRDLFPQASEEELDRFFEEELTSQERDRLLGLPGDEMRRELRRQYFSKTMGWKFPTHRSRRGPYGRGPGSPGSDRERTGPPRNGLRPEHPRDAPGPRPHESSKAPAPRNGDSPAPVAEKTIGSLGEPALFFRLTT
ncbi:MAG: DUF3106 domain-containing protein [Thermoguttaceae bacterium]